MTSYSKEGQVGMGLQTRNSVPVIKTEVFKIHEKNDTTLTGTWTVDVRSENLSTICRTSETIGFVVQPRYLNGSGAKYHMDFVTKLPKSITRYRGTIESQIVKFKWLKRSRIPLVKFDGTPREFQSLPRERRRSIPKRIPTFVLKDRAVRQEPRLKP
ncbi:hypothetical protein Tco_0774617 [Tanacetum coccineum]|uniref:Uncharacterized protein n=1 Tax=Tanacetum coccineum TaxID=301880 RepID=A0ABQ4ZRK1_9ASTR